MPEYGQLLKQDIHTSSDLAKARNEILENKAMSCLDLSEVPTKRVEDVGNDTIATLQELLDPGPKYKFKIRCQRTCQAGNVGSPPRHRLVYGEARRRSNRRAD